MAENPLLDLAQTVMIERFGLDEQTYSIVSFTDGTNAVSIKMSDGEIPVAASFPREFMRIEEMKRWDFDKKVAYCAYLMEENKELPDELTDSFHLAMIQATGINEKPEVVSADSIPEDKAVNVESPAEETEEQFVEKTAGKKASAKVRKGKLKKK